VNAWVQPGGPTKGAAALFLFVVFAFVLLAGRTEINAHAVRVSQWEGCERGAVILQRFNEQQAALADIERDQTTLPDLAKRRIVVYERAGQPLPRCGPRPRPWWALPGT
jgi:hypothetical protein